MGSVVERGRGRARALACAVAVLLALGWALSPLCMGSAWGEEPDVLVAAGQVEADAPDGEAAPQPDGASGDAQEPASPDAPAQDAPGQDEPGDQGGAQAPSQPGGDAAGEGGATGGTGEAADAPATPDGADQPGASEPGDAGEGDDAPAGDAGQPGDSKADGAGDPDQGEGADKGDTDQADQVGEAPVPSADAVRFVYVSHAAPAVGDAAHVAVALQDAGAGVERATLVVKGASGEVATESAAVKDGYLAFNVPCDKLGAGPAQLVRLEVVYADGSKAAVDFSDQPDAYGFEVAERAGEADADQPADGVEASDSDDGADPDAADAAGQAASPAGVPSDAKAWFPQHDAPLRVLGGSDIDFDQAVRDALLALGFTEFAPVAVADVAPQAAAAKPYLYKDTPSNEWYVTEGWLDYVTSSGLMSGYSDGTGNFGPQDQISRAQVLVILYRYANPSSAATTSPSKYGKTTHFSDVPAGQYFTAAVEWAYQNGIATGYTGTGTFGPNDPITRQDLATMLYRFAKRCGVGGSLASLSGYPDASKVSGYASSAMGWANARGIITGDKTQKTAYLKPLANATRAEASKMFTVLVRDTLDGAQLQAASWSYSGLTTPGKYLVAGGNITATPQVKGSTSGLTYEYGWYSSNGQTWRSGSTSSKSYSFYLGGSGDFTLWCQVSDADGVSYIQTARVTVWQALAPKVSSWDMHSWTIVPNFTASSANGFTYEYVWKRGADESTASTLGREKTTATSKTVWLDSNGFYWLYAKVTDPEGHQSYAGTRVKVISGDSVDMYNRIRNLTSPTEWLLAVDTESCLTGVYYKMPYGWEEGGLWDCSPGAYSTPTVRGLFSVGSRGYYFDSYGVRCFYWTQFYGDYLFHSTTYYANGTPLDTRLGMHLSHGCVRLQTGNAKWIYENIPEGTTVYVY